MINLPQASCSIVSIDRPRKQIPSVSWAGPHSDEHQLNPQSSLRPVDSLHPFGCWTPTVAAKPEMPTDERRGRRDRESKAGGTKRQRR